MENNRITTQQNQYQQYQQGYPYQQQLNYYYQYPPPQINSLLSSVNQAIQACTPQTQQPLQQPQQHYDQNAVYPSPNPFYQPQPSPNYNSYSYQPINSPIYQQAPNLQSNSIQFQPYPYHHQNRNQNQNHFNYQNYNHGINHANKNTQIRNPTSHHSHNSEKFPCKPCNQVFYNLTNLSHHLRTHIKCDYENCKFEAIQHVLDLHKEDRHLILKPGTGLGVTNQNKFKKLDGPPNATIQGLGYALKTQEQIDRWIQERKKKWPTDQRIAQKLALAKEKEEEKLKKQNSNHSTQSEPNSDLIENEKRARDDDHVRTNKKRKHEHLKHKESSPNPRNRRGQNKKSDSRSDASNLLTSDRSGLFSKLIEKDIEQEVSDLFEVINFLSSNDFLDGYHTTFNPDENKPSILEL